MIKPWIFEFFTATEAGDSKHFDAQHCAKDYAHYLQRWVDAERSGFEGIFFSEHHFVPGRYSPSPNLLIAAVASRTQRLRLGSMGNVVPFYEPWRLAEEYAMLDHLSGGRLEIGYSSGFGPREFQFIGMPAEQIRPRFNEAVQIIDRLLGEAQIAHQGEFWRFERIGISPRPLQQPLPPRWMTGLSEPSATLAAQRGYKYCTGFVAVADAIRLFDTYRTTAAAAGQPAGAEQLALRRQILIADDDASAQAAALEATQQMRKLFGSPPPAQRANEGSKQYGSVAPDAPAQAHRGPFISDDESIAGSPATVAEQIIDQCRRTGAGHMLAYPFGTLPFAQVVRSYELWPQVIAQLRRAGAVQAVTA